MRRTTTRPSVPAGDSIFITGIILQELLQGFSGPKARKELLEKFAALPMLMPDRTDDVDAAELRNRCRRAGVQLGTVDAAAKHSELKVWNQTTAPE